MNTVSTIVSKTLNLITFLKRYALQNVVVFLCFAGLSLTAMALPKIPTDKIPANPFKNIITAAKANPQLSTYVETLKTTGLLTTLESNGPFTVFAPTNQAFRDLPQGVLRDLLQPQYQNQLRDILLYHLVLGNLNAKAIETGEIRASNGVDIKFSIQQGYVYLNDTARVNHKPIVTGNGTIYLINHVIMPKHENKQELESAFP